MSNLASFLKARMYDRERDARIRLDDIAQYGQAELDPEQLLREIDTNRQIIAYCETAIRAGEIPDGATWSDDAAGAEVGRHILRLLALPHASHPDYRDAIEE